MLSSLLWIAAGLAALVIGGDVAVRAASRIAEKRGISELVIGLTLTSIGTSLPEIATNLAVAVSGRGGADASGVAVGNVVGSNLSQITLLLGVASLIAPLALPRRALLRDGGAALGAMLLMLAACVDGEVSQLEGIGLCAVYGLYLLGLYRSERAAPGRRAAQPAPIRRDLMIVAGGLTALVLGAERVVEHAVAIARALDVSETLIGLGIGLGTGLPELTVAARGARRADGQMSIGNLIGSNITDPLLSFGIGAAAWPVLVDPRALRLDFAWWGGCTVLALGMLGGRRGVGRYEGGALIALFGLFVYLRLGA